MTKSDEVLINEMEAIGPWHMDIALNERVTTGMTSAQDREKSLSPSLLSKERHFKRVLTRIYPDGLAGKTFSDHACNSGGYCFWAKDLGAERTFGYDVRDHWIDQARYVVERIYTICQRRSARILNSTLPGSREFSTTCQTLLLA